MQEFIMNPLLYLATFPVGITATIIFFFLTISKINIGLLFISALVLNIILLCVFLFLYINKIIGLVDVIFLFFLSLIFISPVGYITGGISLVLIPLAMFLSYQFNK